MIRNSAYSLWEELIGQARRLSAFLKSPSLEASTPSAAPIRETATLFIILAALVFVASVALMPFMLLLEAGQSAQLSQAMSVEPFHLILSVVILGPLVEEMLFRSWLSGKWGDLIGSASFAVVLYATGDAIFAVIPVQDEVRRIVLVIVALVTFLIVARSLKGLDRSRHFASAFPWVFWLVTLGFGVLHAGNYSGSGGFALVIFTVPQIIAGAVLGYARVAIGLPSAIALHMAFNSIPVAATIAFGSL